jgi:3-oxoacyl-[acyl-carrier protein] reductase
MYELSGRVALVTGASSRTSIGRAVALRLAREGADVAISDRPDRGIRTASSGAWRGVDSVAEEIAVLGRRSLVVQADLSIRAEVEAMVARVVGELGRLDILVNNTKWIDPTEGSAPSRTTVVDLSADSWNGTLAANLTGPFLVCQAVARQLIRQGDGGKIINIASLKGKRGLYGRSAICAAKAGMLRLTETLALELGAYGINVNAICPGAVASESGADGAGDERDTGALRRLGTPEDQAAAVAFLASAESSFITGQAINVCGGKLIGI